MKKRRGIQIKINFTNRWLYSLIAVGIFVIISAGVYAWANSAGVGHSYTELQPCGANQILKTVNGAWECAQTISPPIGCTSEQFLKWNGTNWICSGGNTAIYAYSSCCSGSGVTNLPICVKASGLIPPLCSVSCGGPGGNPSVPVGFCPNTFLGYLG